MHRLANYVRLMKALVSVNGPRKTRLQLGRTLTIQEVQDALNQKAIDV
jgi:hypothetical protein